MNLYFIMQLFEEQKTLLCNILLLHIKKDYKYTSKKRNLHCWKLRLL